MNNLIENLKKIAPSICIKVEWTEDENFSWDGDGPDPILDGYSPYDVDVRAMTIVNGDLIEGRESLGGCYRDSGNITDDDEDVHGYLPQMIAVAAGELYLLTKNPEALKIRVVMDEEMKRRYEIQSTSRKDSTSLRLRHC